VPAAAGFCPICRGPVAAGHVTVLCDSCRMIGHQLGMPLAPVVPVTLVDDRTPIYRSLVAYKRAPVAVARWHSRRLAALLAEFWSRHRDCVVSGGIDAVTVVPSGRSPTGTDHAGERQHPLLGILNQVPELRPLTRQLLVPGRARLRRNLASAAGFAAPAPAVAGLRLVLLDDTYTTGAHLQSAVASLRLAGARSVSPVVIGRRAVRAVADVPAWTAAECCRCRPSRGLAPDHARSMFSSTAVP
jgi:hypothetical protein